jgi:hypothetical protein
MNIYELFWIVAKVEPDWKRDYISSNHIGVNLIL